MSGRIFINGAEDLSGQLFGTLRVGQIASRNGGVVRYNFSCERCGVRGVMPHQHLRGGYPCPNSACGRAEIREAASDTPAKFRRRTEAAEAAKTATLERELSTTHGKINSAIRSRILSGPDDEAYVSPELKTASMTQAQADRFNRQQADVFVRDTPDYQRYRTPATFRTLGRYIELNNLQIVDAEMLRHAFERLRDCGALTEVQQPEPEPQTIAEPEPQPSETTERTDGLLGWDPATGEERVYTPREVDLMSSGEYKRAFRLTRDKLTIRRQW